MCKSVRHLSSLPFMQQPLHFYPFSLHLALSAPYRAPSLHYSASRKPQAILKASQSLSSPHLQSHFKSTLLHSSLCFHFVFSFSSRSRLYFPPPPPPPSIPRLYSLLTKLTAAVYFPAFVSLIRMLASVCGKWPESGSYTGSVTE